MINKWSTFKKTNIALLAGTIGQGPASEFKAFVDIYSELPTRDDILKNPTTAKIASDRPDVLYALSSLVSHMINPKTYVTLLKYIERMPPEIQVVTLRQAIRNDKSLLEHPETQKWVNNNRALV